MRVVLMLEQQEDQHMPVRKDLPPPPEKRKTMRFDGLKSGDSIHVKTATERANYLVAFKYWVEQSISNPERKAMQNSGAYATSRKVGDEDPDGPGYRIWFLSRVKPDDKAPADSAEKSRDEI